ncbi:hypothetical protein Tco_1190796, partial [Tanacetum coccineum]
MDSPEVNDGSDVWKNQHTWSIQSWKLYSFYGVHVLETDARSSAGNLSRNSGNELTTAVQLIAFLKKQISDSKRPKVHDWKRIFKKKNKKKAKNKQIQAQGGKDKVK